jgi:hypothetical protein
MVEGRPLPTELPKAAEQQSSGTLEQSSDPLPGESETQYVARQRALQEQVRLPLPPPPCPSLPVLTDEPTPGEGKDETKVWCFEWLELLWLVLASTRPSLAGIREDAGHRIRSELHWRRVELWSRS